VADTRRDWQHKLSTRIIRDNQSVREWSCPCGAVHDRDVNAAINVLAAGRAESLNACGAPVRPASVPAQRGEAGSHPKSHRSVA
jgi:putative transposase